MQVIRHEQIVPTNQPSSAADLVHNSARISLAKLAANSGRRLAVQVVMKTSGCLANGGNCGRCMRPCGVRAPRPPIPNRPHPCRRRRARARAAVSSGSLMGLPR
jgi:hypothetical protein